jgi:hypothetical protein
MAECETTAPALLDREGVDVRCLLYVLGGEKAGATGNIAPGEAAKEASQ